MRETRQEGIDQIATSIDVHGYIQSNAIYVVPIDTPLPEPLQAEFNADTARLAAEANEPNAKILVYPEDEQYLHRNFTCVDGMHR